MAIPLPALACTMILAVGLSSAPLSAQASKKPARKSGAPATEEQKSAARQRLAQLTKDLRAATVAIEHGLRLIGVQTEATERDRKPGAKPRSITTRNTPGFQGTTLAGAVALNESAIILSVANLTDGPIKILWDEATFLDADGVSHRLVRSGVPLLAKDQPQTPTVVAAGGRHSDTVFPAELVTWTGSTWKQEPLLTRGISKPVGSIVRVTIPADSDGQVTDYTVAFRIDLSESDYETYRAVLDVDAPKAVDTVTPNDEEMAKLSAGMTKDQVRAAIGDPDETLQSVVGSYRYEDLVYRRHGFTVRLSLPDRLVVNAFNGE
jgi:hypothetical protein